MALQSAVSGSGLVVEIVAGRMIAPYVGMSLYTWTSIIAVVLAGFSIGHWWGGRVAVLSTHKALARAGWILIAAALFTACASLILRMVAAPVVGSLVHPFWAITILTTFAFFLPSLFAGVPAPVLSVVAMRYGKISEHALGAMYAAGSAGAIAGTLLAGFWFVSWLGSIGTLSVISITYLACGIMCFLLGRAQRRQALTAAAIGALTVVAIFRGLGLPAICEVESGVALHAGVAFRQPQVALGTVHVVIVGVL